MQLIASAAELDATIDTLNDAAEISDEEGRTALW
jgi:hypothetical protein